MSCTRCGEDMREVDGCEEDRNIVFKDGTGPLEPIPFGEEEQWDRLEDDPGESCHDCGAKVGNYHHPGCDMEQCPKCGDSQYLFCSCKSAEKVVEWEETTA